MLNKILSYKVGGDDKISFISDEYFIQICEIIKSKYCFEIVKNIIYEYFHDSYYYDLKDKKWKFINNNGIENVEEKFVIKTFNEFIKNFTKNVLSIIQLYLKSINKQDLEDTEKAKYDYWLVTFRMISRTYRYYVSEDWKKGLNSFSFELFLVK